MPDSGPVLLPWWWSDVEIFTHQLKNMPEGDEKSVADTKEEEEGDNNCDFSITVHVI